MGDSYYSLENYEKAIECYDNSIKLDSNDKDTIISKGNCFFKLKKYSEAI